VGREDVRASPRSRTLLVIKVAAVEFAAVIVVVDVDAYAVVVVVVAVVASSKWVISSGRYQCPCISPSACSRSVAHETLSRPLHESDLFAVFGRLEAAAALEEGSMGSGGKDGEDAADEAGDEAGERERDDEGLEGEACFGEA
jgi:hypothetical protein